MLSQAAAAAAGGQQYPAGSLYVVATPIGNLADLSLRAIQVLGLVDAVACEDTRQTAVLMRHLGLHKPLLAVHEQTSKAPLAPVLVRLAAGERVAYVSDAGTPAVSDPGAALVARAVAAGHRCCHPGASSAVAALSVAGDEGARAFAFGVSCPPRRASVVRPLQTVLAHTDTSQVLFEAPHRIVELVALLAELAPQRRITLARELTKQFESIHTAEAGVCPSGWLPTHSASAVSSCWCCMRWRRWCQKACRPRRSGCCNCCWPNCRSNRPWRWRPRSRGAAQRALRGLGAQERLIYWAGAKRRGRCASCGGCRGWRHPACGACGGARRFGSRCHRTWPCPRLC